MNFILSLLVFVVLYWLHLTAVKKNYWGLAIAEYTIILCLVIVNECIWKNHELIFISYTTAFVFLGAGGATLIMSFIKRKDKSR